MGDLLSVEQYERALTQLARSMPHKHRELLFFRPSGSFMTLDSVARSW